MGPKTLPTIWGTYMKLVAEKNATKYILEGQTDRGKTVYPPPPSGSGGIIRSQTNKYTLQFNIYMYIKCHNLKSFKS